MKRILTVTALLLILVLSLTACFGGGNDKKEETAYDILADAFNKTATAGADDSVSVWEKALSGGSIAAEFTYGEDIIPIKTLSGKYYYGKDSNASVIALSLITGETFELSTFSDTEKSVFLASAFTGAYGFTNEGLAAFLTELFAPQEGTAASATVAITETLAKALEKHAEEFSALLATHFPLVMSEAESSLTFSLTVTNTNIKAFLGDIVTIIENDSDFKQAIQDLLNASGEPATSADVAEGFAEMREELSELDENPFNAQASITATTDRIITGASLYVYEGSDATGTPLAKLLLSLPSNGGFNLEATVEGQTFTVACTVTEYGTVKKEVLSIGAMGITLTPLTFTYDSSNGNYEIKVEIPGTFSAVASGNYTETQDNATLTLSSIKVTIPNDYSDIEDMFGGSGDTVIDLPITMTITAKATDTAPKAPTSYTDITKLTDDQMEELGEKLLSDPAIAAFVEIFEDLFGGSAETVMPIA